MTYYFEVLLDPRSDTDNASTKRENDRDEPKYKNG